MPYLHEWYDIIQYFGPAFRLTLLTEKKGGRALVFERLCASVRAHLVGADALERVGFEKLATVIRGRLPASKQIRSGDLAEIIATDYVEEQGEFALPLKRLKYKDDRDMSMRGDDVVGIDISNGQSRLLKAEVKSRASLSMSTVSEALEALLRHNGRPNPSTLGFITARLYAEGQDRFADAFATIQDGEISSEQVTHLIFSLSGNDPHNAVEKVVQQVSSVVQDRRVVSAVVVEHGAFVQAVFEALNA